MANEFQNDNNRVNADDIYSPTEKEVRDYMSENKCERSEAISFLREKRRDEDYDPLSEETDGNGWYEKMFPRVSMEDMMLKVNQHYGPPSKD